jgi:hypothetical protein
VESEELFVFVFYLEFECRNFISMDRGDKMGLNDVGMDR